MSNHIPWLHAIPQFISTDSDASAPLIQFVDVTAQVIDRSVVFLISRWPSYFRSSSQLDVKGVLILTFVEWLWLEVTVAWHWTSSWRLESESAVYVTVTTSTSSPPARDWDWTRGRDVRPRESEEPEGNGSWRDGGNDGGNGGIFGRHVIINLKVSRTSPGLFFAYVSHCYSIWLLSKGYLRT